MDGDFAPLPELVTLRKKYKFLLVIDDVSIQCPMTMLDGWILILITVNILYIKAHGTLLCGETGGGVAEAFNVENEVDIVVGTLSKAVGCQGGFVACRYVIAFHFVCSTWDFAFIRQQL